MKTYKYTTDAETGTVQAETIVDAYLHLLDKITPEMIDNGASLWVEDPETGGRITMGAAWPPAETCS